ncbi:hypothetical protein ACWGIB_25535 [Streptomyces xiamenensis]
MGTGFAAPRCPHGAAPALTAFVPVLVAAQWWLGRALRAPSRRTPFFF